MAACAAAENGNRVTVIEKNEKAGKKIYITGKGRCNLTNDCDTVDFFSHVARNHRFLVSIDGRSEKCSEDVRLTIRRAPYSIKVLKRSSQSFFGTLREKLMWGTDVRE